jgi:hypothetical protein
MNHWYVMVDDGRDEMHEVTAASVPDAVHDLWSHQLLVVGDVCFVAPKRPNGLPGEFITLRLSPPDKQPISS